MHHRFHFPYLDNDFTIVAQAQLYCDRQVDRNIIQSITYLGAIVGLLAINYISDLKGRKFGMITAQAVAIFGISSKISNIK
jgi:MFS family permease